MKKTVSDYINLPYTRIIRSYNENGHFYYYGKILELEGCQSTGDTLEELDASLKEAMELHIETLLELNKDVPVPEEKSFNGKVLFRMSPDLHRKLYYEARDAGISLNQYCLIKLAQG